MLSILYFTILYGTILKAIEYTYYTLSYIRAPVVYSKSLKVGLFVTDTSLEKRKVQ